MKVFGGMAIFFYVTACLILGFSLIIVSFHTFPLQAVENILEMAYARADIRFAAGASGMGIILIALLMAQLTTGKLQRERTIAFDNPDGQVIISLAAIEDLIRRIAKQIPEIKDLRPHVAATKKGVNIVNRVVLYAGANIPEVTGKMQNIVKTKIQGMLGIEEPVSIKVHIAKISSQERHYEKHNGKQKENAKETGGDKQHEFKGIEYSVD